MSIFSKCHVIMNDSQTPMSARPTTMLPQCCNSTNISQKKTSERLFNHQIKLYEVNIYRFYHWSMLIAIFCPQSRFEEATILCAVHCIITQPSTSSGVARRKASCDNTLLFCVIWATVGWEIGMSIANIVVLYFLPVTFSNICHQTFLKYFP